MSIATNSAAEGDPARLSVIVPVYRDLAALERLLPLLAPDAVDGSGVDEVIVAAADTEAPALRRVVGDRARVVETSAGRGLQLNAGAAKATGGILWFVHARATPVPQSADSIRQHIAAGQDGGWFRFRFEGVSGAGARRLEALIDWRARRGIAYGDQGLFFRRDRFLEWGGFEDVPLFEEVRLVRCAKRDGRFSELLLTIGVDPRRWQEQGWIRRTLKNRALALAHAAGVDPHRPARWCLDGQL